MAYLDLFGYILPAVAIVAFPYLGWRLFKVGIRGIR